MLRAHAPTMQEGERFGNTGLTLSSASDPFPTNRCIRLQMNIMKAIQLREGASSNLRRVRRALKAPEVLGELEELEESEVRGRSRRARRRALQELPALPEPQVPPPAPAPALLQ